MPTIRHRPIRHWQDVRGAKAAATAGLLAAVIAGVLALATATEAQQPLVPDTQPAEPAPPPPEAPPEPSGNRPGFFDALGRWLGNSREAIDSQIKSTQESLGTAGKAINPLAARAVAGKQLCAVAPNGAADCQPAADALCKSKGFGGGKSVEIRSSQRCPTRVWIAGGRDANRECRTETFVMRANCQ